MTYHSAVAFVEGLTKIQKGDYMLSRKKDRSLYLKRLRFLLAEIGNPHLAIPNFIHVGGTSGKGTTTMGIAHGLRAAGEQVGAYTSPHITTTVERFWVNGKLMSPRRYVELVEWLKPALMTCLKKSPYGLPSYFEIEFAMALEHFRRECVTWAVIEVGCGGEFDATNAIPSPRAAVITNIGLDHVELLGTTKREIAKTKAGIIKRGSHVFTSERSPAIRRILKARADEKHVPFTYVHGGNVELAEAVLNHTIHLPLRAKGPTLPGRFEVLQTHPLVVLDVAHNTDKCAYLTAEWKRRKLPKPHVLFAASANKDHKNMLKPLLNIARSITFVPFASSDRTCANPTDLERIANRLKPSLKTSSFLTSDEGLDDLLSYKNQLSRPDPILITGSFFLAADLRPRWISEAEILHARNSFGSRITPVS